MSIDSAVSFINRNTKFFLTGHETPDADAIGAECALFYALDKLGKDVRIVNADPLPQIFSFIDAEESVELFDDKTDYGQLSDCCLIMLDANDINNIGGVRDGILNRVREYFVIDHHELKGRHDGDSLIVGTSASTCELVFELIEAMDIPLSPIAATALFAGIVYDTGSFVYPKTTPNTFRIARELVIVGAEPHYVYTKMYESNSTSSLILRSRVLSSLSLHYQQRVAMQRMSRIDLEVSKASFEEGQTFINIPMQSENVRVSVYFKENTAGILRCSMRSKGDIDVAGIATKYGGGGHKNAAGFKSDDPLEVIEKKVLESLKPFFE